MTKDFIGVSILLLCYLAELYAILKFCKKYLEISIRNKWLFAVVFVCSEILLNFISQSCLVPVIFLSLADHICFMGFAILLFRGDTEKKILVVSVLIAGATLVENFCVSFFSGVLLIWLHTVKGIAVPLIGNLESNLIASASFIIVAGVIYWMSKHMGNVFYCKTKKWYILIAVPLLLNTFIVDMANWGAGHGILVRSGGTFGVYYDQLLSHAEFFVLTTLSMFAVGFYVYGMLRIDLEQKKSSQYHTQIIAYKMLEEQYRQSERLRHDIKNHILALGGLLEGREWEKMGNYLRKMEDSISLTGFTEITGNRVVDVLLCQKQKIAERKNIIWECDVQMPKACSISEFDLCVLFGNILDNAVEACERLQEDKKQNSPPYFITIQAGTVRKCFLLEVKNSTDMADKQEACVTNKKNPEKHGIGLLNVRDVVYRYNGVMHTEAQNGVFAISVLVPLNHAVHDIKQVI